MITTSFRLEILGLIPGVREIFEIFLRQDKVFVVVPPKLLFVSVRLFGGS